jgi:hypothetical protein
MAFQDNAAPSISENYVPGRGAAEPVFKDYAMATPLSISTPAPAIERKPSAGMKM